MSVIRLGPAMHNKSWESIMASPQMQSYKIDRPAYSTPPPVENIPTNNECTMVELRGSKVASFMLGCEEYICLPQAFDLFLKHLVGGLHTVYTKLKRLNITPVVCNVEQVRILRGLGAIQPGVNRCKLITRKDFEVLYQDCTTASRPGRPPKRYPVLPPSADLMSHHPNLRNQNPLFNTTDLSAFHKRIRLSNSCMDQGLERRASRSPPKEDEKSPTSMPMLPVDLQSNPNANLAYLQALRQYQQAAVSGLHNGLDPQQINPALAPFMMMSHPALFQSGIPPNSMAMLNHINQIAQSHGASGALTTQLGAAAANEEKQNQLSPKNSDQARDSPTSDKQSDVEDIHRPRSYGNTHRLTNGIGSDGRTSPSSSLGSLHDGEEEHVSEVRRSSHQNFRQIFKDQNATKSNVSDLSDAVKKLTRASKLAPSSDDESKPVMTNNISSMQTLLTNIQGLLKVAADNASLQEKHSSIEIAEIKMKLSHERQLREIAEQKLHDCDKEKAETEKLYYKERKENKKLQGQIVSMQQILGHDVNNNTTDGDAEMTSVQPTSPSSNVANINDAPSEGSPTSATAPSPVTSFPMTSSFDSSAFSSRIAVSQQAERKSSPSSSPSPTSLSISSIATNINNNNSNISDDQKSPDYMRRSHMSESKVTDIAIDLGMSRNGHAALQVSRSMKLNLLPWQQLNPVRCRISSRGQKQGRRQRRRGDPPPSTLSGSPPIASGWCRPWIDDG